MGLCTRLDRGVSVITSWIDLLKFCLLITFNSFKALRPNSDGDDNSVFENEIVGFFLAFVDDLGSVRVSG